jgi:ribonucleoside-diphosphate reductase beta chain
MNKHIVSTGAIPQQTYKLFFGDTEGMLRIDKTDYPVIMNTFKKGFSDVWSWQTIDFQSDILGWNKLDPVAQRIFLLNNGYQTLMDSGVVGLYNYLAMLSTNTELKLGYQYIAQNESIHAASYSYGLSQMFGNEAEDKINIIYEDEFIQQRMQDEVDFSDELFQAAIVQGREDIETKGLIFKAIVATYVLEHIKFPFSFFSTWSLNRLYDNGINGFSNLLKLIAQDELDFHVPMNKNVLKILMKEKRQDFLEVIDTDFIYDYVRKVATAEKKWSEYLLQDGELAGYNKNINKNFIEYFADKTLTDIGLEPIYGVKKNDTIDWYNDYRKIKNQNSALQEVSNTSYSKGIIQNDIRLNIERLRENYNKETA